MKSHSTNYNIFEETKVGKEVSNDRKNCNKQNESLIEIDIIKEIELLEERNEYVESMDLKKLNDLILPSSILKIEETDQEIQDFDVRFLFFKFFI